VIRRGPIVAGLLVLAACGSNPNGPSQQPQTVVPSLELTAPPNIKLDNVTGTTQVVTYAGPIASGGAPPVTITCSPASGTSFPVGTTTVSCNATDGVRSATCQFSVTLVAAVPVIKATRFMAFGDSITDGEVQDNAPGATSAIRGLQDWPFAKSHVMSNPLDVRRDLSYPTVLRDMLTARYSGQTFTMFNEGLGADGTGDGIARFANAVANDKPEAVLLLQGVIDVAGCAMSYPECSPSATIQTMGRNLSTDIAAARARGVQYIFLGTLLPEKTCNTSPCRTWAVDPVYYGDLITPANAEIRAVAARENVFLVDSFAAIAKDTKTLLGGDGLHPTREGYAALANAFFNVIRDKIEQPATSSAFSRPSSFSSFPRSQVEVRSPASGQPVGIRKRQ